MEKEIRNLGSITIKDTPTEYTRHIEGYAIVFNVESNDLGGFTEIIEPTAITEDILNRSDILALLDHETSRGVLARSRNGEGSLKLTIDERGLKYEFDAPKTALGDEVLEYLRRGDISQSSFAFTVKEQEWEKDGDKYIRRLKEFDKIYDVSPVFTPAYNSSSVALRSLDSYKETNKEKDLTEYFNKLREVL